MLLAPLPVEQVALLFYETISASSICPGKGSTFRLADRRGCAGSDPLLAGLLFACRFEDFPKLLWCDFFSIFVCPVRSIVAYFSNNGAKL